MNNSEKVYLLQNTLKEIKAFYNIDQDPELKRNFLLCLDEIRELIHAEELPSHVEPRDTSRRLEPMPTPF